MDTIYALASARGRAGVAVVRISGPDAWDVTKQLGGTLPPPREARVRRLAQDGDVLDEAVVIVFPEGQSFTGEQSSELHLHGSTATISAVLMALSRFPGLRIAEPGEFTRRAFENGRMDLAQVEGLADLVEAETEVQRKQALRVVSGAVGQRTEGWRAQLIHGSALVEASIDFADEEVPVDVGPEVMVVLTGLIRELRQEIEAGRGAERVREGFEVAIVGVPNAGKSTLLNALARRDVAITSERAGTTRDVIEVRLDLEGLPVTVLDTAGLRASDDEIERIGIDRSRARARSADLRVFLLDESGMPEGVSPEPGDIVVLGKADLTGDGVSGKTGAGIGRLLSQIGETLGARVVPSAVITHARHREALEKAVASLESAHNALHSKLSPLEMIAEDLRSARRALEGLVGRVDVEAVLGEIFSRFCIGK
jgi:tRNA modification GTPase